MEEVDIKIIGREYFKETLELFNRVFHLSKTIDFWKNKHYTNPLGDSIFVGVFMKQKLVAMNAFMPIQYIYDGEVLNALESCESAVDSQYRHKGLFSKIIEYAEDWAASRNYDMLIGYPNVYSYPGFIKLGWEVINVIETFGRIENIGQWIKEKKQCGIRPLADTYLLLNFIVNTMRRRSSNDIKIYKISIDEFVSNYQKQDKYIQCLLSAKFLKWKLAEQGNIYMVNDCQGKVAIIISLNGNIVYMDGFENDNRRVCRVLDFFCEIEMNSYGVVSIYIDSNKYKTRDILKAGLITKRESKQNIIIKRLSPKSLKSDRNIAWWNQVIEKDFDYEC